jgi:class 3 adenylate cyclase/tetratricopeptide (TPR) repeat protein
MNIESPSENSPKFPRRSRSLADLTDALADASASTEPKNEPAVPRRRSLSDVMSALDQVSRTESPPPPNPLADLIPTPARPKRSLADLNAALQEPEEKPAVAEALGEATIVLPERLQKYLPPDLWRKLNGQAPSSSDWTAALEYLRSLLYQVSTFIPAHVVQEKLNRPVAGLVSGHMVNGSLLFTDVSGFTALSEKLAVLGQEGAERLTAHINEFFSEMIDIIAASNGILLKFAGDATLVYFPAQDENRQAGFAVRAAQRMLRSVKKFSSIQTPGGGSVTLRMKIGVATGQFLMGSIGSVERMEYIILGDVVERTLACEGAAAAGLLVVDTPTLQSVEVNGVAAPRAPGLYALPMPAEKGLDDFEIRADKRRARGAIAWTANPRELVVQMEMVKRQLEALLPYLAPELTEQVLAHAQQRRLSSQFRPTTVIFGNFYGPEQLLKLWGQEGAARVTRILSAYFEAMNAVVARFGGMISRIDPYNKGTKLLALFGAPVSHEDDARRAVSAVLTMNAELENLNRQWVRQYARHLPEELRQGPLLQHRWGITQGRTFAGQVGTSSRREYTVMGDDVNLSARLMSAGGPSQVLVNQAVVDEAEEFFAFTELQPVRLKGKSKPVQIYQVDGTLEDALLRRARQRDPLLGRELEMQQAVNLLEQVLAGRATALLLRGAVGMGKSHFADALLQIALQRSMRVLPVACRAYQSETPYAVWALLMRTLCKISPVDKAETQHEKLNSWLLSCGLGEAEAPLLAALMGLSISVSNPDLHSQPVQKDTQASDLSQLAADLRQGRFGRRGADISVLQRFDAHQTSESGDIFRFMPGQFSRTERLRLQQALMRILSRLSAAEPLLLFFEDAQWMDEDSQKLLVALLQDLGAQPVLALLASRQELPILADQATLIELKPLDQQGTLRIVTAILAEELALIIHKQSGGSPLFVEEISRWLQRTRKITATDVQAMLQSSDILTKLVLSGVESLPEAQREVLRVASVIGGEFRASELSAILMPPLDPVTLDIYLRALVMGRFLRLVDRGPDRRYAFQQTVMRDTLYQTLPFARRRELHKALADFQARALTERSSLRERMSAFLDAGLERNPVLENESIAQHYELAQAWVSAAEFLLRAGRLALQQRAYARAAGCFVRAQQDLANLSLDEMTLPLLTLRAQAFQGQGDALLLQGDFVPALTAFEQCAAIVALPSAHLSYRIALALTVLDRGNEALDRLLVEARLDDLNWLVVRTWLAWRFGSPDLADWLANCRAHLPTERPEPVLQALLNDWAGDYDLAKAAYRTLHLDQPAALATLRLGDYLLAEGDPSLALDCYQEAEQGFEGENDRCGLALLAYRRGEAYWRLGQTAQAQTCLNEALKLLPACSPPVFAEGRELVRQALRRIQNGAETSWPQWRWQAYDDLLRLRLFFIPN